MGKYNSEELPYGDEEFDRYIANLSLHIVENPEKMLSESYRILKQGGIAAFTVWAERSECTFFALNETVAKEILPRPEVPTRSHFHLCNRQQLKELVKNAGFSRVLCFVEPVYVSWTPEQHIENISHSPELLKMRANNPELAETYLNALKNRIIETLASKEEPFCFASNVIIAYK